MVAQINGSTPEPETQDPPVSIHLLGWRVHVSKFTLGFWFVLGLGAVLRLVTLDRQSLWLDEGFSYWVANRNWAELLAYLPSYDTHPPLYYLMLQPMIALGGSEWLLRFPSVVAGIASIGLIYSLGAELFKRPTALVAGLILAISPLHIWYAQEARMYALVMAFVLGAALFAVRAVRTNRSIDWIMLSVFESMALWTDVAAIWFTLALNVAALLLVVHLSRTKRLLAWGISQVFAFLLYVPWLPAFLQQLHGKALWIPPATITVLVRTVADMLSFERTEIESGLALLLLLFALSMSARNFARAVRVSCVQYVVLGCWLAVPMGLAFLISQPYVRIPLFDFVFQPGRSVFLTRNLIVVSIPFYLLVAKSVTLTQPLPRAAILIGLLVLSGIAYVENTLTERKEDYRTASQIVTDHTQVGDVIILAPPYLKLPFSYYYYRQMNYAGVPLDNVADGVIAESSDLSAATPTEAIDCCARVWLITNSNIYQQDTLGIALTVSTKGRLLDQWQVEGVTVQLYAMNSR